MSGNDNSAWQRTSPLAATFFVGKILQAAAKNVVQSLAPIAAFAFASEGPITRSAIIGAILFAVAVIAIAILRYLFFRFRLGETSILIRDGIIRKKQLDIRFERIQAVNTEQNVVYRPFGLVNIRFDTAGSSQQEGYLPAVPAHLAETLEARIERHGGSTGDKQSRIVSADDPDAVVADAERTLRDYSLRDLLIIGLTSNRAVILLAIAAPFIEDLFSFYLDATIPGDVTGAARRALDTDPLQFALAVAGFTLAFLLLLAVASIGGAVLRYFRFRLTSDRKRLRSSGGLLTRHEHAVRYSKIQALYVHQNLLQRMAGIFRLSARQAASGKEGARKSFMVPLVERPLLDALTQSIFCREFPDADLDPRSPAYTPVARHYVTSSLLLRGLLPALAATALMTPAMRWAAPVFLIWVPLSWVYFSIRYRHLGIRVRPDGLSVRSGFLGRRVVALVFRKVQRVTISQSPFQRRRRLATVKLYLASGSVRVPFIGREDAERLRDYILFRVETDTRPWH